MTIGFGRRRLVMNFVVDQSGSTVERYPSAEAATDRELARLKSQRDARFEPTRWESNAALYGVGWPR
ncbi:hypothetical protein BH23CHL4_BH23CHL4_13210 [soil metagenome]